MKKNKSILLSGPYILWMLVFTLIPLGVVGYYALTDPATGGFSIENIRDLWMFLPTLGTSVWYSLVSALICLVLGYPVAYFIAHRSPTTQKILYMLIMLPMCMSFLLRTLAWVGLLESNGIINSILCFLGIGQLTVIKDLGLKEPYIGKIDLATGEIAEDLTMYYFISEQQNTAISLGVMVDTDYSVKHAGGMIIQMLPFFANEAVDALENMLNNMKPITTLIEEVTAAGSGKTEEGLVHDLLDVIFKDMPEEYQVTAMETREMHWECDCSMERLEKVLMTVGVEDLRQIIEEDGQAEMVCQFCCKKYHFDKEHLEKILEACL